MALSMLHKLVSARASMLGLPGKVETKRMRHAIRSVVFGVISVPPIVSGVEFIRHGTGYAPLLGWVGIVIGAWGILISAAFGISAVRAMRGKCQSTT